MVGHYNEENLSNLCQNNYIISLKIFKGRNEKNINNFIIVFGN